MDINRLLQQLANTRQLLFDEKHLNKEFLHLEYLERNNKNLSLVENVLDSYFARSAWMITAVEHQLKKATLDFSILDNIIDQLGRHTTRVGANNVMLKVNQLSICLNERQSIQSCKDACQQLKLEREIFKEKLEFYFRMKLWDPPEVIDDRPEYDDESD